MSSNFKNILTERNILVVDDEEKTRDLYSVYLKDSGANIFYATNGQEAVAIASNGNKIDLVSMDINMPVMDGVEALKKIKSYAKNSGREIPVLASTAHALPGDSDKFLSEGFDAYISVPVKKKEYLSAIVDVLYNSKK